MRFITHPIRSHPDRPSRSDGHDIFEMSTMDRSIVTVDHFDRTVTPKCPIKQGVLPICKAFELEIKKLICIDTSPLESLDSSFFSSHFCIHGGQELEIWLSRLREIDA